MDSLMHNSFGKQTQFRGAFGNIITTGQFGLPEPDYQTIFPHVFSETYTSPFNPYSSNDIKVNPQIERVQKLLGQEKAKKDISKKEDNIVNADDTQSNSPTKKRVKKEKIPATLKNILWHKYFETSLTGICQCCKVETISKSIFDAGHIISEKNGGKVVLDNLKPICKLCNSSMGRTNMDDFMKKYGI